MDEGVRREKDIQREYANVSNSCAPILNPACPDSSGIYRGEAQGV